MSDILSDDDLSPLAAEYVLGTLDANERTRANVLLDVDHQFRGMVRIWERRLGELHLMVEPVEPDAKIWERLRGKLKNVAPPAIVTPPAPTEVKPADASATPAATTGQKLAGIALEVGKLTDPKSSEPAPAEPEAADSNAPEAKAQPDEAAARSAEPQALLAELAPKLERPAADTLPTSALPPSTTAEAEPTLVPKPEPGAIEPNRAESRPPDRIKREPPGVLIPATGRDAVGHLAKARAARPARVGRWRAFSALMTLVAIALGGLIAAWRYVPERLPPQLRPTAVLNLSADAGVPVKKPAPPDSQFDE